MAEETEPLAPLSFGILLYGAAAIAIGLIGLVWGDFATDWQHVNADIPFHGVLAYGTAALEIIGGAAMFCRRTARFGVGLVTLVYLVFALIWACVITNGPLVWDSWGNLFEQLSIVISGAAIDAYLSAPESDSNRGSARISRLYGICPISFGLTHFFNLSGVGTWVPKWMPFGGFFWAAATGTFLLLAAFSILTGFLAGLGSRLNAIMIVGFELLVWIPRVAGAPHDHFNWSGNGICTALAGGAWAVSDMVSRSKKTASNTESRGCPANNPQPESPTL
jgi:hypothetical protein